MDYFGQVSSLNQSIFLNLSESMLNYQSYYKKSMFNPARNNWHKCDVNVDKNDVLTENWRSSIPYHFLMNVTVEKEFSCIVCNIKTF